MVGWHPFRSGTSSGAWSAAGSPEPERGLFPFGTRHPSERPVEPSGSKDHLKDDADKGQRWYGPEGQKHPGQGFREPCPVLPQGGESRQRDDSHDEAREQTSHTSPPAREPLPGHVHAPFPQVAFRLRLPEAEEGDGLSGVTGVASQAGREVRDAGQLHDADGEVAPGGHRAGRVAGPQLGGVSGKVVSRTWCRALMPQWSRTSRAS
jgi:hypothetical protein